MMKRKNRILLLTLVILNVVLLSACTTLKTRTKETNMVEFETGNYFNKDWNESVGNYEGAAIPNGQIALEIATTIFNGMEKSKTAQEYEPHSVFYDEQDEIWIVSFAKPSDEMVLGGDCNIALQKTDGRVLRIWFGE